MDTYNFSEMSYRQLQIELADFKKAGHTKIKLNSKKEVLLKELEKCFCTKVAEIVEITTVESNESDTKTIENNHANILTTLLYKSPVLLSVFGKEALRRLASDGIEAMQEIIDKPEWIWYHKSMALIKKLFESAGAIADYYEMYECIKVAIKGMRASA